MKRQLTAILLVIGITGSPEPCRADLIEKRIVAPNGGGTATGVIFQGSRNMRDLGKRRSTVSSVVVPSLNPVTVIPALQNAELQPKPRFGYGSDYRTGAAAPQAGPVQSISAPVYQFRYSYPVHRDYWITSPYRRYFSPYYSCGPHFGWSGWSGFSRFSLSFGW